MAVNFVNINVLENISTLDLLLDDEENIKHINDVNVGPECETFLETLPLECAQQIRLKCLDFYITAVREMLKCLPYKDELFKQLIFLDPKIALYNESRHKIKDLTYIAKRVEHNIDITKLAFEWTILPLSFDQEQKEKLASLPIDEMWNNIVQSENFDGEKMFPNLELLIEVVLCYPHSNAEAERIFSILTDVKNKKRNRLSNDVSSICVIRSFLQAQNINCTNFNIDARHLELHNAQNLYGGQCTSDSS